MTELNKTMNSPPSCDHDGPQINGSAARNLARSYRGGEPLLCIRIARTVKRICLAVAVFSASFVFSQQHSVQDAEEREALVAFSRQSGPELVSHNFDLPSIPIFVIRRLIYLDDPRVIPALHEAFERQRKPLTREFIAAALVRLGDADPRFFDYVAGAALDAEKSDIPYPSSSITEAGDDSNLEEQEEIRVWAQAHNVPALDVIRRAMFDVPGAVEAVALTKDRRAVPILLQALQSSNLLVVREGALGLARMRETPAIPRIIIACQGLGPEDKPWLARSLLYFHSKSAQETAGSMIDDSARLRLWNVEIDHEESTQTEVRSLSGAVQALDRASVDLDHVGQALRESGTAAAEKALSIYVGEIRHARQNLARLPPGSAEDGLATAVLARIEAQRSELRGYLPGFGGKTAQKAQKQVDETYMMIDKLIKQSAKGATSP